MRRFRRFGVIAAFTVMAGLIGAAFISASNDGHPAPIVWRDHVIETTTTTG